MATNFSFFFLVDSLENNNVKNPVSLRKDLEEKKTFSNFGVSPTFQNYVAKKLDEIIEKYVINFTMKYSTPDELFTI